MEGNHLMQALDNDKFDPDKYVNDLAVEGEDGLLDGRGRLQVLGDDTRRALKKNVYANYLQFIDATREIKILEGEMYQLNHMLTDQKNIMTAMMENSIASDKDEVNNFFDNEDDSRKNLAFLMEKVEGCSHVIEVPGRHLIHDGDVVELEPESFVQLSKYHMFLLNDSLMLAHWQTNPNKRGPVKYKYEALYELDNLAVVNVRDVGPVKNAFKVLMFPDTRMYQVENPKAKRQWLEYLEGAKKKQAAKDKARRDAVAVAERRISPESPTGNNPFEIAKDNDEEELLSVEGLRELPEDLDVLIAQRDFEGAVDRIDEANLKLEKVVAKSPIIREYKSRIDSRIKQLTEILTQELKAPPERTLRSGSLATRTAVTQLIRLGKSAQACQLFLRNRSAVIKYNMRQLKIEGATTLYIKKLSEAFFSTLRETSVEFYKAFPQKYFGCFSGFIVWSKAELQGFIDVYKRQVFGSKAGLTVVADCVHIARTNCSKRAGLDLVFIFNSFIHNEVEKVVREHVTNFIETTNQRGKEDKWTSAAYPHKSNLNKFLDSMITAGFTDIEKHVFDGHSISLTPYSLSFCESGISFIEDLLKLNQPSVQYLVDAGLKEMWNCPLTHIEQSLGSVQYIGENNKKFITKNASWLEEEVLPIAEAKYLDTVGYASQEMKQARRSFGRLKSLAIAYQAELV